MQNVEQFCFSIFKKDGETDISSVKCTRLPHKLDLSITEKCNLRCKHCSYALSNSVPNRDMSLEMISMLEKHVFPNLNALRITGFNGEAMCHPYFDQLLKNLIGTKLSVSLTTNGTLINKDRAALIVQACDAIDISIEGVGRSYQDVRGKKWDIICAAIANMNQLRDQYNSNTKIILDVTTIYDYLNDYESLFSVNRLNVDGIRFRYYFPQSVHQSSQSLLLNVAEGNAFMTRMQQLGKSMGMPVDIPPLIPTEPITLNREDALAPIKRRECAVPWEGVAICPTGEIKYCCAGPSTGVFYCDDDKDLRKLWNDQKYIQMRETVNTDYAHPICYNCSMVCEDIRCMIYNQSPKTRNQQSLEQRSGDQSNTYNPHSRVIRYIKRKIKKVIR